MTSTHFKTGTSEGISSTLLPSLFQRNPTYHRLPPSQWSSRPASITVWSQDKLEVSLRSLLSLWGHHGSWQVISCSIITGPHCLTMTMLTYCMCHTIIILKIHTRGKAKTMSVSTDARGWWKATQWHFCLYFRRLAAVRVWRAAESDSHRVAQPGDCCC